MDFKEYEVEKAAGRQVIVKVENTYAIFIKRYSEKDATEQSSDIERIDIDVLNARKEDLQDEINAIDIVIADCQALDV